LTDDTWLSVRDRRLGPRPMIFVTRERAVWCVLHCLGHNLSTCLHHSRSLAAVFSILLLCRDDGDLLERSRCCTYTRTQRVDDQAIVVTYRVDAGRGGISASAQCNRFTLD
jgi:hypothetical protein